MNPHKGNGGAEFFDGRPSNRPGFGGDKPGVSRRCKRECFALAFSRTTGAVYATTPARPFSHQQGEAAGLLCRNHSNPAEAGRRIYDVWT